VILNVNCEVVSTVILPPAGGRCGLSTLGTVKVCKYPSALAYDSCPFENQDPSNTAIAASVLVIKNRYLLNNPDCGYSIASPSARDIDFHVSSFCRFTIVSPDPFPASLVLWKS